MRKLSIEIAGLSCTLGGNRILRGLDLGVGEGEFLSIIGPNGAGKTTLLKCIMKIVKPESGAISVMGRPIGGYSQRRLAREVAYVPQAEGMSFPFTVEEFVLMGRYPHLSPFTTLSRADMEAAEEALITCGIPDLRHRRIGTLSGGEKQMTLIAAALAQSPSVMLLDEPAAFLDPRHSLEICELLARINAKLNKTVITVTHDINSTVMLGGFTAVLAEGRIEEHARAGSVIGSGVLERVFGKDFIYARHPVTGDAIVAPDVIPR